MFGIAEAEQPARPGPAMMLKSLSTGVQLPLYDGFNYLLRLPAVSCGGTLCLAIYPKNHCYQIASLEVKGNSCWVSDVNGMLSSEFINSPSKQGPVCLAVGHKFRMGAADFQLESVETEFAESMRGAPATLDATQPESDETNTCFDTQLVHNIGETQLEQSDLMEHDVCQTSRESQDSCLDDTGCCHENTGELGVRSGALVEGSEPLRFGSLGQTVSDSSAGGALAESLLMDEASMAHKRHLSDHTPRQKRCRLTSQSPNARPLASNKQDKTGISKVPSKTQCLESPLKVRRSARLVSQLAAFGALPSPDKVDKIVFLTSAVRLTPRQCAGAGLVGTLATEWTMGATHLIATRLRPTLKLMSSICRGLPVLRPEFLDSCAKLGRMPALPVQSHLLKDTEGEAMLARRFSLPGYKLMDAIRLAQTRGPVLKGFAVEVVGDEAMIPRRELRQLVEAAGGVWKAGEEGGENLQNTSLSCLTLMEIAEQRIGTGGIENGKNCYRSSGQNQQQADVTRFPGKCHVKSEGKTERSPSSTSTSGVGSNAVYSIEALLAAACTQHLVLQPYVLSSGAVSL